MKAIKQILWSGVKWSLYAKERYFSRGPKRLHVEKYKHFHGEIPAGYHVHHIDGNTLNNDISNLKLMKGSEHLSMHSKEMHAKNPERTKANLDKIRPLASDWHASDEGRQWHKKHAKDNNFGNQVYGQKTCVVCGGLFEAKKKNKHKFCSNACKSKHRLQTGIDLEERKCLNCGKSFQVNKYYKTKCCSRKCSATHWRKKKAS